MSRMVLEASGRAPSGFVSFDPPNSIQTGAFAENGAGQIAGVYDTASSNLAIGFIREANGNFETYEAPGSEKGEGTIPRSINSKGAVAESATKQGASQSRFVYFGSIRESNGKFIRFQAPGANLGENPNGPYSGTESIAIDDNGDVAGGYYDSNFVFRGYIRKADGTFVKFDPPGSYGTYICYPNCLNDDGSAAGEYYDAHGAAHGFYRDPSGKITEFSPSGGALIIVSGLNGRHVLSGTYVDSSDVAWGWIHSPDGRTIRYQAAGAYVEPQAGTEGRSINSNGAIAGGFTAASDGVNEGFLRAADGTFTEYRATQYSQNLVPYAINSSGSEAGLWVDGSGQEHGFVWTP